FVILNNRTTTANPDPIAPWQSVRSVLKTGPQEQIAIWSDSSRTLLVWAGDAASPNLNIMYVATETMPTRLQLGIAPRTISWYPAPDEHWQILWLDRSLTGEDHLMAALVARQNGSYTLERGPTEISSRTTLAYSAGVTPAGDLFAAWSEAQG